MTIGMSCALRYCERKCDNAGWAEGGMGRTVPEIESVTFGWVRGIGSVDTFATGARESLARRETVNGRVGIVACILRSSGMGFSIVAFPARERWSEFDSTRNDKRVTGMRSGARYHQGAFETGFRQWQNLMRLSLLAYLWMGHRWLTPDAP